ncbi:neuronal pentraxin-2 [Eptesicus fuscus]|uniref:neuronal pentraxin-2 n=1 Tax=Eptesicus fuscus TaxID=29078 RepID=UPI002404255C|nr:neuronal pentraxin-2 [Eptesicus fuscus]
MLALLVAGVALAVAAAAQDVPAPGSRFVCTALPPEATRAGCPLPAMPAPGGALSPEEELRAAVLQLRETVVQQKETLGAQREAIRELTAKLARCEGLAGAKAPGRAATGKDTMGDLPRDPGHMVEQLSRSLQTLKDRLESLEHQLRGNVSSAALPGDFREALQRRLGELERQLLRKVAELEDEKSLLHNETSAHRQKTESALNALLQRVSELERGNSAFKSPDAFKVSLPLRTNYLYGKIKKTLPELYAFTICLWLRSSASPGIGTPFSYAVPGQANEIVLIEWGNNPIELLINDKVAQLPLFVSDGKWHHICVTWTTRDGMWAAFQDGEKLGTGENLAPWHPIKPGGVLILGQEQDTIGGRFDATQAFVGELSQFNIWDRVLRAQEIVNIANCSTNMPGNVIPWVDSNVDVFGGASKWPAETCEERLLDL